MTAHMAYIESSLPEGVTLREFSRHNSRRRRLSWWRRFVARFGGAA